MRRRDFEVRTEDGRRLRALEVGPEDGELIVFHTGTPGCREVYSGWVEEGADRGLRHVCYARPGYDGSDRHPDRTHADCVGDTRAIVDALGEDSFYVLGYSGGGQHALACGALMPDRVRSVVIGATCCPRGVEGVDWLADTAQGNVDEFGALAQGNGALERFLESAADELREVHDAAGYLAAFGAFFALRDVECLTPAYVDYQVKCCPLVVRDGIWGWFDDDHAAWGEWGFDPTEIAVPVSVWHGIEDRTVPPAHGEWLGRNIPEVRLHLVPGESHVSLIKDYYGAMLDELIALR